MYTKRFGRTMTHGGHRTRNRQDLRGGDPIGRGSSTWVASPGQSSFALRASEDTILRLQGSSQRMAREHGLPSVARAQRERRMVDQNSASWNQVLPWLRRVDTLRGGELLTG